MPTAIFTFNTEDELAAMYTQHPVRGVLNGDIAIICGGNSEDDVLVYKAVLVNNPPESSASASPSEGTPSSSP